ncbi:anti-sigma regulatory factor (Ser/Thr protein kinase) [Streptomyces sp. V4I23]|uniref:ATP-binding protein n=1 Tax=Streptomyces sp. V4I23 TaxID=3042282 RepID=UPI00277FC3EE|nr:ATP-binding protein [Streptomyces sp. V4I23]MDQ1007181.1 anti-sigma regulatory factor (Ser/Thr protein kinase) [Streptomyces sp. V4I23]
MIAIERASDPAPQRAGPTSALRSLAHCAMPSSPQAARALRRFVRAVARRWRLAEHFDEALSVIVTELVTNVVMHSGSPWVSTAISLRGELLLIEVMDAGCWKHRPNPRQEPLDADVPCGRGLRLVDAYATRTVAHRTETGSMVRAEIALSGGPRPPAGAEPALDLDAVDELDLDEGLGLDQDLGLGDEDLDLDVDAELELEDLDMDLDLRP